MPIFLVRHRDGRPLERVEADACSREGAFWVLRSSRLVVNVPRELVVRRLPASDVELLDVELLDVELLEPVSDEPAV